MFGAVAFLVVSIVGFAFGFEFAVYSLVVLILRFD